MQMYAYKQCYYTSWCVHYSVPKGLSYLCRVRTLFGIIPRRICLLRLLLPLIQFFFSFSFLLYFYPKSES